MTEPLRDPPVSDPHPPPERVWPRLVLVVTVAVAVIVALVLGFAGGLLHPNQGRSLPPFPSLSQRPDDALHGTVAYFANDSGCIRIVAAAGRPSRQLLCLSQQDLAVKPAQGGKPAGPQLVWRSDGRLEVTMFFWTPVAQQAPSYRPLWQRLVDVRTGAVQAVPLVELPAAPITTTGPTVSPSGQRVGFTFDPGSGRARVTVIGTSGMRTLLSVRGPGEYTYRFGPVFWAPNWQWIAAADDGRVLVITPGDPPATRVLLTRSGAGAGGGTAGPAFAVTAADLLTATK